MDKDRRESFQVGGPGYGRQGAAGYPGMEYRVPILNYCYFSSCLLELLCVTHMRETGRSRLVFN